MPAPATVPQIPEQRSRENDATVVDATIADVRLSKKRSAEESLIGPTKKSAKIFDNAVPRTTTSVAQLSAKPIPKSRPATLLRPSDSLNQNAVNKPTFQSKPSADRTPFRDAVKPDPNMDSKKEPKKGSFAEIMARAKANQAKPQAVGTINHKPKEKGALTLKKELKLQKQALRDKAVSTVRDKGGSRANPTDEGRGTGQASRKSTKTAQATPVVKSKPQPVYKGTMNAASVTARTREKATAHRARGGNEYAGTDEELDEHDQSENNDGYGFGDEEEEESDDMEAGFSDVEQEETAADRAGRREDEEEARVEARLKREKEERKRRVEELAKRAKPQRY